MEAEFVWRTGVNAGPISMALDEFIARTFECLRSRSGVGADCVPAFDQCRAALLDIESPRGLQAAP
jgi:bacterioferritin-associated ferredoxin